MNKYDIIKLGLILSIQAEIEGMKADNMQRQQNNESMAYVDSDFQEKANKLQEIVYKHNDQL